MSIIAISIASTEGLSAPFHPRFGRAPAFVLTDPEGLRVEVVLNHLAQAGHGAGTGTAAMLAERGVSAVVSGRFGPKAAQALGASGIAMWIAPEGSDPHDILTRLGKGELELQVAAP